MDPILIVLLAWAGALTVGLALFLAVIKLAHREVLRWRGVRTAHYIAAIGELVSRGMVPQQPPISWADDPYFHHALAEYRLLLTGHERKVIDSLVERLGVHEVLIARAGRRWAMRSRLQAVSSLVDLADERQVPVLRALMADSNSHVRVHAVRGLARLCDTGSVSRTLDLAKRVRPWEAARIADALVDMGMAAVRQVVEWIEAEKEGRAPNVEVVALAARVIGLIGDPDAEPVLLQLLRSSEPEWRLAAASALESTGGEEAVPALLDALDDRDWRVRARVAVALGATAEPGVARPVSGLLNDPVWWVRQNAASSLGNIPGGTDYLMAAVGGLDPYAADASLNQLTVSGVLREALDRVVSGHGTDRDRQLASLLAGRS